MTYADHDATLAAIRDQLANPLPIGTDHPPRQENPAMNGDALGNVQAVIGDGGRVSQYDAVAMHRAIERVKALHSERPWELRDGSTPFSTFEPLCDACRTNYPCPTIRALEGAGDE